MLALIGSAKIYLMKKVIFLSLIIFLLGFYLIPNKVFAENKCGDICTGSTDCQGADDGCGICVQDNINQEFGGCEIYGACHCKKSDQSIHEGGSEVIVDYVKPITQKETSNTTVVNQNESFKDLTDKVNQIIPYAIGIGGLIAFFLMIFGGLQIILSGGNPEKVKAGKEIITSAIAGLLLIIFSVFILRLIGVDLLNLPGFNK